MKKLLLKKTIVAFMVLSFVGIGIGCNDDKEKNIEKKSTKQKSTETETNKNEKANLTMNFKLSDVYDEQADVYICNENSKYIDIEKVIDALEDEELELQDKVQMDYSIIAQTYDMMTYGSENQECEIKIGNWGMVLNSTRNLMTETFGDDHMIQNIIKQGIDLKSYEQIYQETNNELKGVGGNNLVYRMKINDIPYTTKCYETEEAMYPGFSIIGEYLGASLNKVQIGVKYKIKNKMKQQVNTCDNDEKLYDAVMAYLDTNQKSGEYKAESATLCYANEKVEGKMLVVPMLEITLEGEEQEEVMVSLYSANVYKVVFFNLIS